MRLRKMNNKKTWLILTICLIAVYPIFALEIKVGAGLQYKPINRDITSKAFLDKDSWNLSLHSQYNWKYFGFLADFTFDYMSRDYSHFTIDLGFDGRYSYRRFTGSFGATFPFTINNGKFGLDDISISSIPEIIKNDRVLLLLWGTKIFGGLDYAITDEISAGLRYSYICGRGTSIGTWLSEMLQSASMGTVDFIFTYRVL